MDAMTVSVSHTRMAMYSRCPQQFYQRYILGKKRPPGVALLTGRAVDGAINADLDSKMLSGELLSAEEVEDVARECCHGAWEEALSETDVSLDPGEDRDKARGASVDQSVALAGTYHRNVAPSVNPTHVQRQLNVEIPDYDASVVGYIDVQERGVVVDNKTTGKSAIVEKRDGSIALSGSAPLPVEQLSLYSMLVAAADGEWPETLRADFLVKTKEPKSHRVEWAADETDKFRVMDRIGAFVDSIQREAWGPTDPDSWWCSERWCGYWDICPYSRRPLSVVVEVMREGA